LGTELYFVFIGSFSTIKNNRFPSADTVGRNSAKAVLILAPKFSTLMIVDAVIIFSFCGMRWAVSIAGWEKENRKKGSNIKREMIFLTVLDLFG